jgi:hypothetical protein
MVNKELSTEKNLMPFFMELIEEASEHQNFYSGEMVTFYMVNLLVDYIRTERLYANEVKGEATLVSALEHAMNADEIYKETYFKRLGDYTLFVSGFFHDSLSRSLVDVNYYIGIGKIAYSNLASVIPGTRRKTAKDLYGNISKGFKKVVDILSEVSDKVMICNNRDVLRIYDRWLKTGSERDKSLLKESGVIPIYRKNALTIN